MVALFVLALAATSAEPAPASSPASPASSAPAATIDVAFQPGVGLTDAEYGDAKQKITDELGALGFAVKEAPQVDPGCVPDVACVEKARADGNAPVLLVVEMVRVGPVVQLTATGSAGEGKQATGTHGLDAPQLAKGPLLPDNVRAWAKAVAAAAKPKVEQKPETPPPAKSSFSFTPAQSTGLFIGAAGAILVLAGTVCIAAAEPTLEDKSSLGSQKSQAAILGYSGIGALAVGAAAVGAGAIVFFVVGGSHPNAAGE